jgi:hypothetical protein
VLNTRIDRRQGRPSAGLGAALGPRQCQHLAAVVAELGSSWSVELHDDAPGGATIMVLPVDVDDPFGVALFVHNVGSAFHVDELCGDNFRKLCELPVWTDVVRAVRIRLLGAMPVPLTLH